jgi:hypothetical protein
VKSVESLVESSKENAVSKAVKGTIGALVGVRVRSGTGIARICDTAALDAAVRGWRASTLATGISGMMSLVRLLGFTNLSCGCVTGHYRELATNREITYVEEKGSSCDHHDHRRNHTLAPTRFRMAAVTARAS